MNATYTHTGNRPQVGYAHCGKRLHGHRIPKSGRTHAFAFVAGVSPEHRGEYTAVCGETVECRRYDEFGYECSNFRTVEGEVVVTCDRCRKVLGI